MALLTTEQRLLAPVLNGAQTVWTGHPLPGIRPHRRDLLTSLFGIPWTAFAVFWTYMATKSGGGVFFPLWGVMFICVGVYFTAGHYVWDAFVRSRTTYCLCDNGSAYIVRTLFGTQVQRLYLPTVTGLHLESDNATSGTVVFGDGSAGHSFIKGQRDAPPAFEFITDASAVYDLCTKLQQGKSA